MTMDDIAHEVGIGKGTIYLYFPSKEEVSLGWIDRANCDLRARMKSIADLDMDIQSKLREMLICRVMTRFDQAQDMAQSLDELFSSIRLTLLSRRDHYHKLEAELFSEVLINGVAKGEIACDDFEHTALALLYATNSMLPYSLSVAQLGNREEINRRATIIANLLLTGLIPRVTCN